MRLLLLPVNHVVEELKVPQLILLLYLLMKRYMLEKGRGRNLFSVSACHFLYYSSMPLAVRSVLCFCHFLYHSSDILHAAECSISVTACIEPPSHSYYCQYTAPFLILPVFL
jgi:hypothetical protein